MARWRACHWWHTFNKHNTHDRESRKHTVEAFLKNTSCGLLTTSLKQPGSYLILKNRSLFCCISESGPHVDERESPLRKSLEQPAATPGRGRQRRAPGSRLAGCSIECRSAGERRWLAGLADRQQRPDRHCCRGAQRRRGRMESNYAGAHSTARTD